MKTFRNGLTMALTWLLVMQPWISATASVPAAQRAVDETARPAPARQEARELTGYLVDRTAEYRALAAADKTDALGEDGLPAATPPLADLPVVDAALSSRIEREEADAVLRVIVYLDYLPHAGVLRDVLAENADELNRLETDRQALLAPLAAKRNLKASRDSENYSGEFDLTDKQRADLRELGERNEALSLKIKTRMTDELRDLLDAYQSPVRSAIGSLGGKVEFSTIAGNMIIATISPSAIDALAKQPGVMRIVEDSMMEGHLNLADNSSMVDPADTSELGLWDNGQTGGAYDPATIDSGVDQNHPGLKNKTGRSNFCSWYLVAGNGSANFGDAFSCDDNQGHGTHVQGIVGSYGSSGYTANRGMAYGVEKMVNLKAGWLNSATGRASMFWSDKYMLVDRALYHDENLVPSNSFADDVDGMNLSYGGDTTLDDTDGGRFWDSVIATYPDLPVTISAGNSGPSNTLFSDPAVSYNAIVVANANDRNTVSRNDDIIRASSTVGPTAGNRRKPDIAAPGTSILAPNHAWETAADYIDKTGTSMAAPMVLGIIMDLMDAGLTDEKSLKAVLINTAQKNLPGLNIESDSDGWDPQIGWGLVNAYAAYHHRFDVFQDTVTPRNTTGEYHLYKGVMRDEGASGEGRDRVTMVWNREATYSAGAAPSTYYGIVDLNLRLYGENNNSSIDTDLDGNDNVHQVRIGAGAGDTDVVVKAYAWSTNFSHGGATQAYSLATEEGFTRVDLPTQFQGIAYWPTSVEPNEVFDIEFWLRNDSAIASHNNSFNLELPAGFTRLSGIDTVNIGSAPAGGYTAHYTWTVRAPNVVAGAQNVVVKHSHNSYLETYGDFNWNMGITVEVDNTAPNPNPMGFSTLPYDTSTSQVSMVASFATDLHGPVEYYLDYMSSPSGGPGGNDSGWQASRTYADSALGSNDEYCYRAWARDNANFPNLTTPSAIACTYTAAQAPTGVSAGLVTTTAIDVVASSVPNNLALGNSGLRLVNTEAGNNSGWKQNNNPWTSAGLVPASGYTFVAQARNGNADTTASSPGLTVYTLANPPAVDALTTVSATAIKVALDSNGNSSQAEYRIENTTAGTNSGWIGTTSYQFDGLDCETFYNFQARARNGDGVQTILVSLGLQSSGTCVVDDSDGDGVSDDVDNCQLVANAAQIDTDGDGIGNSCDADLNNDCVVNFADLAAVKAGFFPVNDPEADFSGDGLVNFADLAFIKSTFFNSANPGPGPGAPGNVCD